MLGRAQVSLSENNCSICAEAKLIAHARLGGPFGNRGNTESREQTIANGKPLLL